MKSTSGYTVLTSLVTGVPNRIVTQEESIGILSDLIENKSVADPAFIKQIASNCKIKQRHSATDPHTDKISTLTLYARYELFRHYATPLITSSVQQAIHEADLNPSEITSVIYVTNTGFAAPFAETLLCGLGIPTTAKFTNLSGMGCGGGLAGLRVAHSECISSKNESSNVLLVVIDLSSIHETPLRSKLDIILHSLFADGCAAAVLKWSPSPVPGKICVEECFSTLLPDSSNGIVLSVDSESVKCTLSPKLSTMLADNLSPAVDNFLKRIAKSREDIDIWAVHPGGPAILEASQKSLDLNEKDIKWSWDVLSSHGNMLAPSVLFVLKQMMEDVLQPKKGEEESGGCVVGGGSGGVKHGVAVAFSPGVRVEGMKFILGRTTQDVSAYTGGIHGNIPSTDVDNGLNMELLRNMFLATRPWTFPMAILPFLLTWCYLLTVDTISPLDHVGLGIAAASFLFVFIFCNLTNTIWDFINGVDTEQAADDRTLVDGVLSFKHVCLLQRLSLVSTLLCTAIGALRMGVSFSSATFLVLQLVLAVMAWGYTAPPLQFKSRRLGEVLHILVFGPAAFGSAFLGAAVPMPFLDVVLLSLPHTFFAVAVIFANNARDVASDQARQVFTLPQLFSRKVNTSIFASFIMFGMIASLTLAFTTGLVVFVVPILLLPQAVHLVKKFRRKEFHELPQQTALIVLLAGAGVSVGLLAARFLSMLQ